MRDHFHLLGGKLLDLSNRLLTALALALNKQEDYFVKIHSKMMSEDSLTRFRSLYYPRVEGLLKMGLI